MTAYHPSRACRFLAIGPRIANASPNRTKRTGTIAATGGAFAAPNITPATTIPKQNTNAPTAMSAKPCFFAISADGRQM